MGEVEILVLINDIYWYVIAEGHNNNNDEAVIIAIKKHTEKATREINDYYDMKNKGIMKHLDEDYRPEDDYKIRNIKVFN